MKKLVTTLSLITFSFTVVLSAQEVTLQFMQTKYDIKEMQMTDPAVGYAVGLAHWNQTLKEYRSTVLKTMDGGSSWNSLELTYTDDLWDVCFTDQDHGWAAGNSGLLICTVDGGASWQQKDMGTTLDFKSLCFTDDSHGWLLANEVLSYDAFDDPASWSPSLWHTVDGGESWSKQDLPDDAGLIHSLYFKDDLEGWALGVRNISSPGMAESYCAAYYTADGGETWVEKFSPDLELVFTDMDFPDDSHGYLVGFASSSGEGDGSFFRTSDGGESWERLDVNGVYEVLWEVEFIDDQRGYALGTGYGSAWGPPVYRTLDGGESWDKIGMEEHDNHGLFGLYVSENKVLGLGDKGYLICSEEPWGAFDEWGSGEELFTQEQKNTLYRFEDIFFVTPEKGWVVGRKSTGPQSWAQVILHTDNGGEDWDEQYAFSSDGAWSYILRMNAVQFVNETNGWAVGYSEDTGEGLTSGILFTDNGGKTWTQQAQDVAEGQMVDVFFLDSRNGWILTDATTPDGNIQVLKTSDAGLNWEIVDTGIPGYITIGYGVRTGALFFQDELNGWILGAQCDLLRTRDGGDSWESLVLPDEWTNTFDIAFSNGQQGTICGEQNYHTTNGGESWSAGIGFEGSFTHLCFTDTVNGWMVREQGEIYRSTDGGALWEPVEHEATGVALTSVSFPDNTCGWACGLAGTIIHIDPSANLVFVLPSEAKQLAVSLRNYPNPFSLQTEIELVVSAPDRICLDILDLNGRVICELYKGFLNAGTHSFSWSRDQGQGRPVNPGIYVCRMRSGEGVISTVLIVQ